MIPYSLGSSVVSATSGIVVSHIGKYRQIIWLGFFLMTIGYGLMTKLDDTSNMSVLVTPDIPSPTDFLQRRASSLPAYRSAWDGLFVPDPAHCVAGGDAPEGSGHEHSVFHLRAPTRRHDWRIRWTSHLVIGILFRLLLLRFVNKHISVSSQASR